MFWFEQTFKLSFKLHPLETFNLQMASAIQEPEKRVLGFTKVELDDFFSVAIKKAGELQEKQMVFLLADANGKSVEKRKVKWTLPVFFRTAKGKIKVVRRTKTTKGIILLGCTPSTGKLCSENETMFLFFCFYYFNVGLLAPKSILEMLVLALYRFPKTVICGLEFNVVGCQRFEYEDLDGETKIGFFSASGSLDASKDLDCVQAAFRSLNFAEREEGLWSRL